ncbi:hypothetical protein [Streptomyces sp. NPDC058092]|uniref:hypothetical protein n=1 Tax=Streptomyces sp. NPDC058092 TaxID=3346336 RepID=UPI0036E98D97
MTTATAPTVTRRPENDRYANLGKVGKEGDDFFIVIAGQDVGGTYYCTDPSIPVKERWASWGPAGLQMGFRTREDAERVQVAAYNPADYPPPAPNPEPAPVPEHPRVSKVHPAATDGPLTKEFALHVDEHMVKNFASTPAGDWECGRLADNTAVVVWQVGTMGLTQSGVRGTMLLRWLHSLHDAGFVVRSRTDMEIFGRPDEQSKIAWWLHITGWAAPEARTRDRFVDRWPRPMYRSRVAARPDDPNPFGGGRPVSYHFMYWAPGDFPHPITYAIEYATHTESMSILPPDWLVALAEEQRPDTDDKADHDDCDGNPL